MQKLLPLSQEIGLLLANLLHLIEVVLYLFEVSLSLGAGSIHISNKELKLARPLSMLGLESILNIDSLLLHVVKLSLKLFDLSLVTLSLVFSIGIFKLLQFRILEVYLILLSLQISLQLLIFDVKLVGMFSLLLDLLGEVVGHELDLLLEHQDSLLSLFRLLLKELVLMRKIIVYSLLLQMQLG